MKVDVERAGKDALLVPFHTVVQPVVLPSLPVPSQHMLPVQLIPPLLHAELAEIERKRKEEVARLEREVRTRNEWAVFPSD